MSISSNINTLDELRHFYYSNLAKLYDPCITEEESKKILKLVTVTELQRLLLILCPVPIKHKNKQDLLYLMRRYFADEARVDDMVKRLNR